MNGKLKVFVAALVLSALVLGCTGPTEKTVKSGDTVYVDYVGSHTNGTIFETTNATVAKDAGIYDPASSYTPYSFVVGSGSAIPGFDQAVRGMKINETKNVTIAPENAYGQYNASNVMVVSLKTQTANVTQLQQFLNQPIYYNDEYVYVAGVDLKNGTASLIPLSENMPHAPYSVTVNPGNKTATLDFNHPLAGKTLNFRITIVDIK